MKEKKLKIIITLMTSAVIALLVVQLLWITKSVEVEKERFVKNVNDALLNISERLVKTETATVIVKEFSDDDIQLKTYNNVSATSGVLFFDEEELLSVQTSHKPDSLENYILTLKSDSLYDHEVIISAEIDSFITRRTLIVNDLIEELIIRSKDKPVSERLDEKMLPVIITEELSRLGIETEFNFAIFDTETDSLYFVSDPSHISELKNSIYKASLFPDEVFTTPSYLLLNFPDQELYFLESIQSLLIISLGIFLLIVGVFYQSAHTLLKQKKISDIKNDLINNITHEFKTPLSTISLTCEALKEPDIINNKDTVERYRDIIATEKDRLQKMVDVLLNTAMFERDKLKLNLEEIEINTFVKNELSKHSLSLDRLKGKITVDRNTGDHYLFIDKFHFGNVISNLIDNSIKYCVKNPVIVVEIKTSKNFLLISVEDNGIGINKKNLEKVFNTFYRVPTGNIQNAKGFGIGLSYAKKIVEAHDGTIRIHSKENTGSKVTISLPLKAKT